MMILFHLKTAFLNIRRHRSKSLLVVLICALIVIFVFIYMNNIEANRKELLSLPQTLPINCQIENLGGTQIVGLEIGDELVEQLAASKYVKDLLYTTRLGANFTSVPDEPDQFKQISIMGANDIHALPNLQDRQIDLMPGESLDFLQGKDALCLADDTFLMQNRLSVGDTVELALYAPKADENNYTFSYVPLGNCSLRIVGSMKPVTVSDNRPIHLLCPAGWAKAENIQGGEAFYLDSASFKVANPMELDAFKAAMKEMHLMSVVPQAEFSVRGGALSVKDGTFIQTASHLKNNLAVLFAFAPVIFIVIVLVGYAIAYLMMQGRRADIAIMRSLGTSRPACVLIMLIEYAALGLAGSLLGAACAAIWAGLAWSTLWVAMLFFASLMLGVLAASVQLSGSNTMTGLKKTEA